MFLRKTRRGTTKAALVEEFKKRYPNAKCINHDNTKFEIRVPTRNGTVELLMTLPVGFPDQRPIITAKTHIRHHLFDSSMRLVGHRQLQSWSSQSKLGSLVDSITSDLQAVPPNFIKTASVSQGPSFPPPVAQFPGQSSQAYARPVQYQPRPPQYSSIQQSRHTQYQPTHPSRDVKTHSSLAPELGFQILDGYKIGELENLIESDEEQLNTFIESFGILTAGKARRDNLYKNVENLAKGNLELRPSIEESTKEITGIRKEVKEKMDSVNELVRRQNTVMEKFSKDVLRKKLSEAVSKADEASEETLQKFNDGDLELTKFINSYIKARTLYHKRLAKQERLNYS
eukprot:CAMPEP_0114518182 /NCGR_PEP_ID=MMETSP0109-20121206/18302_1 /TAXON_ID=29199 /ORGANISM="Chlorarachnion reptans, Strain CCCM449" /LENGTH=342 /DNA_ID=CAMNT_0001698775 /DNA_START=8 /DNA_END=1036 /DNA_ORIENTATION=-